jgi:hypothetical protein
MYLGASGLVTLSAGCTTSGRTGWPWTAWRVPPCCHAMHTHGRVQPATVKAQTGRPCMSGHAQRAELKHPQPKPPLDAARCTAANPSNPIRHTTSVDWEHGLLRAKCKDKLMQPLCKPHCMCCRQYLHIQCCAPQYAWGTTSGAWPKQEEGCKHFESCMTCSC